MRDVKCTYEGCPNPPAFLCPQIADERPCGWIWLPVCAEERHSWWEGGDFTEESCPVPTIPLALRPQAPATIDGPTVKLNFNPQTWVRDYAMSVDPEGDTVWEVSKAEFLTAFPDEATFDAEHQLRDDLRLEGTAPKWIRDWYGPFEVELIDSPWEN